MANWHVSRTACVCPHCGPYFRSHIPLLCNLPDALPARPHVVTIATRASAAGKFVHATAARNAVSGDRVERLDWRADLALAVLARPPNQGARPGPVCAIQRHLER